MDNILLRQAKPIDAKDIATVHVLTWQCAYKGQLPHEMLDNLSIPQRTEGWKKQLENQEKGVYAFVIEVDGNVVGWCTGGVNRDEDASATTAELYGIYVHPEYIGKGLGSKLMEHFLLTLRKNDYEKVTLWVLNSNQTTRQWYESKGWKIEGKTKTELRDGFALQETRYIIDL